MMHFRQRYLDIQDRDGGGAERLLSLSSYRWKAPRTVLRTIYTQFVRSSMEYASVVWSHSLNPPMLNSLDVLQNKGSRIISECLRSTPISVLSVEVSLSTVHHRFVLLHL